jgi:hypothetical protein
LYAFPFRPEPLCSVISLLPIFVDNIIISIFFNSCFKNNNKKNVFDLKNVHISQKKLENKYVTIATMIICVLHFLNISDIFYLHSRFKNNIKKNGLDLNNFDFSQNFWKKICCHGSHDNMCKTFCEHS